MLILILFFSFLLVPSLAHAWGPLTHVYLGTQVLDLGAALIPAGIYRIIKKYRDDFLYGNLSADIIIGKRFQIHEKNSHTWKMAWKLFELAKTERQKAFAYGYLTHLCADTVAHNLDFNTMPFKHPLFELKSESMIDKKYRKMFKQLDKPMQMRNDLFLENTLESVFFSFKTNKRIFRGFLALSRLSNYTPLSNFIGKRFPYEVPVKDIYRFQKESLERMFELLNNGKSSKVLKKSPRLRSGRFPSDAYSV